MLVYKGARAAAAGLTDALNCLAAEAVSAAARDVAPGQFVCHGPPVASACCSELLSYFFQSRVRRAEARFLHSLHRRDGGNREAIITSARLGRE